MDVSPTKKAPPSLIHFKKLFLLLALSSLAACAKKDRAEEVFPEQKAASCLPNQIQNEFVVRWQDGSLTLEHGKNREQFIHDFIRPRLEQIARVEYNRDIQIDPVDEDLLQAHFTMGNSADNWGTQQVKADKAWQQNITGDGVVVAVIDTGVDLNHPQLTQQIYINQGEFGTDEHGNDKRFNAIDDDGNGYIDDYAGYDFVANSPSVQDYNNHGTHVAGIIAAYHEDSVAGGQNYVQGVAPNAQIMPLAFIGNNGGSLFNAIRAIEYAADNGAHIINASWGGPTCSVELADAIRQLENKNVLFVAAAGNRGIDIDRFAEYPAAYNLPNQITVGSIGKSLFMANHSNYGDRNVHIFAPGVEIYSTVPGNSIRPLTGTSMATPFVAGALALMKQLHPNATSNEMKSALYQAATKSSAYRNVSQGRLNIECIFGVC